MKLLLIGQVYAGYALSSVEGRVAMEFFDLSEASQAKKYTLIIFALYDEYGYIYIDENYSGADPTCFSHIICFY